MLPSEMIEIRKAKFEGKFNICNNLRYYRFPSLVGLSDVQVYLRCGIAQAGCTGVAVLELTMRIFISPKIYNR